MSVARWLETDSLSNQNIASAAAIGAYTADADRMIVCDVTLYEVAGNGDYVAYVTRQIAGAGAHAVVGPKTTLPAASGETALSFQSGMISVRSGDVLTVYVDGLAGDTATPDTVVRIFEVATLRPATADRQVVVAATGEASANVTYWAGFATTSDELDAMNRLYDMIGTGLGQRYFNSMALQLVKNSIGLAAANLDTQLAELPTDQDVRDALKLAPTAGAPAAGSVDAHLDDILAVAPNNKPTVAATGEIAADVTKWAGDPVNDLVSGEVPANLTSTSGQVIADATKLLPAAGLPAIGSVAYILPTIPTDVDVQAAAAAALTAYDPPTLAELTSAVAPLALETTAHAILTDSNELQTDWANGGRLDVILDAAAAGGGLDAAGVRAAVGLAAANLDTQLGDIQSTVDQLDDIFIYTLTTDGTTPIRDALVQAFSDEAMTTIVDYGITDYYGKVRLHLMEPGTYYLHRTKVGVSFVNPDNETIP